MALFDEKIVKDLYGIDADYWDMYEYLYEISLNLEAIESCLNLGEQNIKQAKDIIIKTNIRIGKIVKPWIDFKDAYSRDIKFDIKKTY